MWCIRTLLYEHEDHFYIVGIQEYKKTGIQEYRNTGIQEYKNTGIQEYKHPGIRKYRNKGIQEYRNKGIQEYRNTRIQEYRKIYSINRKRAVNRRKQMVCAWSIQTNRFIFHPRDYLQYAEWWVVILKEIIYNMLSGG